MQLTKKSTNRKKYSKRIAVTAGAAAGALLTPGAADAAVIHVTGAPVTLGFGGSGPVSWDVDGAGGAEFELFINNFGGPTNTIHLASVTSSSGGSRLNGWGLVGPTFFTDNVQALFASFNVGPTLASNFVWGSAPSYRFRNALQSYSGSFQIGYDFNFGFAEGDNFFGFRFGPDVQNLQYGWGVINFDTTNGVVSITQWAYETQANTAIHIPRDINAVPEPSSLALLATGAAGLMYWRSRRRKDEDEA